MAGLEMLIPDFGCAFCHDRAKPNSAWRFVEPPWQTGGYREKTANSKWSQSAILSPCEGLSAL